MYINMVTRLDGRVVATGVQKNSLKLCEFMARFIENIVIIIDVFLLLGSEIFVLID